ncbi:MAG TPA: VOC family protein [Candidatus Limnocylindria bacterium]|nr:VOC family protein [Candidatus Limnocylindria bacterium]
MTSLPVSSRRSGPLLAILLLSAACTLISFPSRAEGPATPFTKPVIDIGMVVSDIDKSVRFYTNVIGFREVPGFDVPAAMGKKIGLTDSKPVKIRVFELGEGNLATKLKLMSFPDLAVAKPERKFVHSTMGLNYLTIYVSDITQAMRQLKEGGVKLLGESPVELGGGTKLVTCQDPDGTFLELIGPAKAP